MIFKCPERTAAMSCESRKGCKYSMMKHLRGTPQVLNWLSFQVPLGFPHHPGGRVGGLDVERVEKDGDDGEGVGKDAFVAEEVES